MSDWQEVHEGGQVFWVHDELGNVLKSGELFFALMPKVIKLGPFDSAEQAQQALSQNRQAVDQVLDALNNDLVNLSKQVKR